MELRFVLDTNIVIYMLNGKLAQPLPVGDHYLFVISLVELLGFKEISAGEVLQIEALLNQVSIIQVDEAIARQAAFFRQTQSVKVPDAIIAASTISVGGVCSLMMGSFLQ